ncbi:MAG: lytic transglycosylase domain-containing protein [Bacilli bacterium]
MRKNSIWNPFSLPTKDNLLRWLLWRGFLALGVWGWLGLVALLLVTLTFSAFMMGNYTGGASVQSPQNRAIANAATVTAAQWESGLTPTQVAIAQAQQVDLPSAVLVALGKMQDNFRPLNFNAYYPYLAPSYIWQTFTDTTTTERLVWKTHTVVNPKTHKKSVKRVRVCVKTVAHTPVTELMHATTWDGTLVNTYAMQTTGSLVNCSGVQKRFVAETGSTRTYTWSRVWTLLAHIHATAGKHPYIIHRTKVNEQILAGLIAAQNVAIADPHVQRMADVILSLGLSAGPAPSLGTVGVASGSVVQNVLRYKALIAYDATRYGVPAALVAGVMAQESGGREHGAGGVVLSSGVGSGGLGALGLMQVEPTTASGMYVNGGYIGPNAIADLSNPATNIQIGVKYIAELYHQFGGNVDETLSAYNAGPQAEMQALASGQTVAQNPQTMEYVANITGAWMPAFAGVFVVSGGVKS